MRIEEVATSSRPWYIGRHQGATFFGHTRIEVLGRCMEWLRHQHDRVGAIGTIDGVPIYFGMDFAQGDDQTLTVHYEDGKAMTYNIGEREVDN